MSMYFECELNKIDIDEVLSTVRYIEPEDLVVLYREKIRRLESALKNSEDGAEKLMTENERLKEELKLVREDNCELREAVTTANMRNGVLTKRNRELKQQLDELEAIHEKDINKLRADLAEGHINSMELAGDLVFAEVRLEKANKKLLNSHFGVQSMPCHDLMTENRRLLQRQASLETQINILNANSDAYRKDVDQLTRENKKLIEERDALWDETQHLDKMYKQLLNEKKRLQENFEELKASSDLSMTAELTEIFSEFIDKDDKNRADLSAKIDEFKEKYQFE